MLNDYFMWFGVVINFVGGAGYIVETVRGTTQPNRVTWFVWSFSAWIAFAAQMSQGVGITAALTFSVAAIPGLIFFASFFSKGGYWQLGYLDIICGVISLLALGLWQLTAEGNIAITLSIVVDAFAGIPTIVKSIKAPETESASPYVAGLISSSITILSLKRFDFAWSAYPVYLLVLCTILTFTILLLPRLRKSTRAETVVATNHSLIPLAIESVGQGRLYHVASAHQATNLFTAIFEIIFDQSTVIKPNEISKNHIQVSGKLSGHEVVFGSVIQRPALEREIADIIDDTAMLAGRLCIVLLVHPWQIQLHDHDLTTYARHKGVTLHMLYDIDSLIQIAHGWPNTLNPNANAQLQYAIASYCSESISAGFSAN